MFHAHLFPGCEGMVVQVPCGWAPENREQLCQQVTPLRVTLGSRIEPCPHSARSAVGVEGLGGAEGRRPASPTGKIGLAVAVAMAASAAAAASVVLAPAAVAATAPVAAGAASEGVPLPCRSATHLHAQVVWSGTQCGRCA